MVHAVLLRQRSVLEESISWTRGALARTLTGQGVHPLSHDAWRWSLSGALARALFDALGPTPARSDWERLYDLAQARLRSAIPEGHPWTGAGSSDLDGFNDYPGTYHEDVLDLIDRALESEMHTLLAGPLAPSTAIFN